LVSFWLSFFLNPYSPEFESIRPGPTFFIHVLFTLVMLSISILFYRMKTRLDDVVEARKHLQAFNFGSAVDKYKELGMVKTAENISGFIR
ncbi:MAG: hypothetical protein ACMUHY_06390, partial [Thermoplasmatota archaeon]